MKLHIDYAFTIKPEKRADEAIKQVEALLNSLGVHGGNVKIMKDTKISGQNHVVAQQVSMGGGKARRFLRNMTGKNGKGA